MPSRTSRHAVDDLKAELEVRLDATIADMTKLVEAALLRLPARVKAMSMREFVGTFGGKASLVAEHERKEMRLARTVAKAHATSGAMPLTMRPMGALSAAHGRLNTILKPLGGTLARTGSGAEPSGDAGAVGPRPAKVRVPTRPFLIFTYFGTNHAPPLFRPAARPHGTAGASSRIRRSFGLSACRDNDVEDASGQSQSADRHDAPADGDAKHGYNEVRCWPRRARCHHADALQSAAA